MPTPPVILALDGPNHNLPGSREPRMCGTRSPGDMKSVIEVHLSNVYAREPFRRQSFDAQVERCSTVGFGRLGFPLALDAAAKLCKGAAANAARQIQ